MVILGDNLKIVSNRFEFYFEIWMSLKNFIEVLESFICVVVYSPFALRFFDVRHCCFSFLFEQRKLGQSEAPQLSRRIFRKQTECQRLSPSNFGKRC